MQTSSLNIYTVDKHLQKYERDSEEHLMRFKDTGSENSLSFRPYHPVNQKPQEAVDERRC